MTWTTPADLRAQVQRWWDRGDLLRATVSSAMAWPARLSLKAPGAADLSDRFEAVRDWATCVADVPHVRTEWRDWKHRVQGAQRLPAAMWVDSLEDALAIIGKLRHARQFVTIWQQTGVAQPALLAWLSRRPLQALEHAQSWQRLLGIVAWLLAHPRPGVYLRQVDVPGVDSKFIEAHRGVLGELLDTALPPASIVTEARGVGQFARRFGFLDKPARIRFRLLDATLPSLPGCAGLADIALDTDHFASLALGIERVFITENEINFLAFPALRGSIVVFGAGYGWEPLARATWLRDCRVHYWGDLDTHGFAILDQLRGYLPHATSILMDRETLLEHRMHWGQESDPIRHELTHLTMEEREVYDDLRFDRFQSAVRLEQERVGFGWLQARLGTLT